MSAGAKKINLPFVAVALAVTAGLAFFALYGVGRQLWLDDTHSSYHAFGGVGGVVDSLRTDSQPPLYFLLLSAWMAVGGLGEAWLRLPSIAFYLLGGLILFGHGHKAGDSRWGALSAGFYWLNPVALRHIHTVRPYSLVGLFAAFSMVCCVRLALSEETRGRWWVGYIVVNALGTFTHYWFFLLLAGQAVAALLFAERRARWQLIAAVLVSAIPFVVFWMPVLMQQVQGAPTSWMTAPGGWWLLSAPFQLMGDKEWYDFTRFASVFYVLLAITCVVRTGRRPGFVRWPELQSLLRDRRIGLLMTVPVAIMVIALIASQWRPIYHVRYVIVATPALAMLFGLVLDRLGDRRLVPVLMALLTVASLALRDDTLSHELELDDRAVTTYVIAQADPGDDILNIALNYAPTMHYLRALAPGRVFSQAVFPREVAEHPGWINGQGLLEDRAALEEEASGLARSFLIGRDSGRVWLMADLHEDSAFTAMVLQALEDEFVLDHSVSLRGWRVSEIRAYSRRRVASDDEPPGF